MTWRVGRKVARTVYENDQIMFLCTTPEDAQRVVAELNQSDELRSQIQRERENADGLAEALEIVSGCYVRCRCGALVCKRCKDDQDVDYALKALAQHAALRSEKEDGNG